MSPLTPEIFPQLTAEREKTMREGGGDNEGGEEGGGDNEEGHRFVSVHLTRPVYPLHPVLAILRGGGLKGS